MFQNRTNSRQINRFSIINDMHRMGIAHIDANSRRQIRLSQINIHCVHIMGQRNIRPITFRRTHINRDQITVAAGVNHPALCFHADGICAGFRHHQISDTAAAIAASGGHTAVTVHNMHGDIGNRRWRDDQNLIAANAKMTVSNMAGLIFGQIKTCRRPARARIKHDKIIADPLHFDEFNLHIHASVDGDSSYTYAEDIRRFTLFAKRYGGISKGLTSQR